MRRLSSPLLAASVALFVSVSAFAQNAPHFNSLVIDAGGGNTITLEPPTTSWTGNLDYQLPTPPSTPTQAGFVEAGSADGQVLTWDNTNQLWVPTTGGSISGTGTTNRLPMWSSSATLTNSAISENSGGDVVTINGNLVVTGTSTFNGAATFNSTALFKALTTFTGGAKFNSAATFNNTADFNGVSTFNSTSQLLGSTAFTQLSYAAGATINITSASQSIAVITDDAATAANSIAIDAGATNGQLLIIINNDADPATVGTVTINSGASRAFVWDGSAWQ